MATSMQHVRSAKGLLTYVYSAQCKMNLQHSRRLHHLICCTSVAVSCRSLQLDNQLHRRTQTHVVLPCRTMSQYRHPKELYKTLYEKDHPFYKIIKYKKKKYVPPHPLPLVEDPTAKDSSVLLYDDEETLRSMGQTYLADKPVDDIYVIKHYPPQIDTFHEAVDNLRSQGDWDFSPDGEKNRQVNVTFVLDAKLDKKKKVPAFQGFIAYPHQFTSDNRVLCFAEGSDVEKAQESGAYLVIGTDKVLDVGGEGKKIQLTKQDGVYSQPIREANEEVEQEDFTEDVEFVDYIVAAQNISQHLLPLKKTVKAKFPTSKKGSIQRKVEDAVKLYKTGTPYECKYDEEETLLCHTSIGKMDLSNEQLEENLQHLIADVCKRKDLKFGAFITEISVTAPYLDTYVVESEQYLPRQETEEEVDLAKELEMLEKEMEKIRMKQAS